MDKVVNEAIVNKVAAALPEEEILYDVAELFKVLVIQLESELFVLCLNQKCVYYDLAACLDMTQSAISHQLRILKQANLVKFRRDGKLMYYSLDDEHVKQIFDAGYKHVIE